MAGDIHIDLLASHPDAVAVVAGWLHQEWFAASGHTLDEVIDHVGGRLNGAPLPLALIALAGGQTVGTVSLVLDRMPNQPQPVPFLGALYVAPDWRRRGVGSLLCAQALDEARRLNFPRLFAYTTDQEAFYVRQGWQKRVDTLRQCDGEYRIVAFLERNVF